MRNRALAATILVGLAAAGCNSADGTEIRESEEEQRVRTMNVEVLEIQPEDFTSYVRVVGTVEAERDVTVAAEEGGVIRAILARKGDRVSAGAPLLKVDDDVLQAQLAQAASQAALAEETWERQRRLWEDEKVGTEMNYLRAKYEAETARAQARVLNARVDRTTVRAPIAGILDERRVEVGSMVAAGAPVVRILDVDTVKIVGGVPERYAADIGQGSRVSVTVDALGGREYVGEVDFVSSAVSGDNRTFTIEVEVPNPGLGIKPGMVANVQIARASLDSALVVPRHAVMRRENGYVVYVADRTPEGWRARAQAVVPGSSRGERVVIEDGLRPGELVVVVGQQQVAHGDALVLTDEARTEAGTGAAGAREGAGEPGGGTE